MNSGGKPAWPDQDMLDDLGWRIHTSRMLGQNKSLVLHGGGNTSVKIDEKNIFGEQEEILYVKGSGHDLKDISAEGFSPVRCDHLRQLAKLTYLSDAQMVNEMVTNLTRATAPVPSVEAILHAILPFKFVDHTHADAVVSISNSVNGEQRLREIYGQLVVYVPYVMPGFELARLCAECYAANAGQQVIGMILLRHGVISFANTAKESYERMLHLVGLAEDYLRRNKAWDVEEKPARVSNVPIDELARLRYDISSVAGPMIIVRHADANCMSFVNRDDLKAVANQGPATPDHVIRSKRLPLIGRDVQSYVKVYKDYFARHEPQARERKYMLDPAPRVVLDRQLGLCTAGRTAKEADILADIYRHSMDIMRRATGLGGYCALSEQELFEVEYWDLEQAKLKKSGNPSMFSGEIALVTGAASGIGKACVKSLLARAAAVVAIDRNPSINEMHHRPDFFPICCDLSDDAIPPILDQAVNRFGGLDMLLLNAGVFPASCSLESLSSEEWRRVMRINLDVNQTMLRECYPLLKLAPQGGRVLVIGSKNVAAPGPGAAAYSASKAALNQLARVAALEWGGDNIRVNSLHPNAVFDTGIWSEQVLASRAMHYGLSIEEYKRRNLLQTEVTSHDVAELASEMCGRLFAKTTGAQLPIDGGNDRVV